jgi:signal peptidase I
LEKSLYNRLKIELELEERLDAIEFVGETPERLCQTLEPGTKAIDRFDELGIGRTLLILGEPGSGKTITLLEISKELIERAAKDPKLPIPVVFSLSSWNREKWTIKDWLVQEFETGIYKINKEISKTWIQNQQLLLLLDGLDEIRQDLREPCVQAINRFSQSFGQTEIIVCSRVKAYEAISQHIRFQTALFLHPLTPRQMQGYLDQAGDEFSGIKLALHIDPVLQELARSPLMLSIMLLAYQGTSVEPFAQMSLEERLQLLWDRYIDRMLERKQESYRYPRSLMLNWLGFLAQRMIQKSQTLFLIEQINPSWLESGKQRQIYTVLVGLITGLLIEWIYGIPLGLIQGMLTLQMLAGLLLGFALGVVRSLGSDINLLTSMGWSWSFEKAWKAALPNLLSGPLIGALIWFLQKISRIATSSFLLYLIWGSITGLVIAIISVVFAGLVPSKLDNLSDVSNNSFATTNQGVWQSADRALLTTLVTLVTFILPLSLLSEVPIPLSVILACISLYAGGLACIQHLTIRIVLWQVGSVPWNYTNFLNDSTNRLLFNKSGGGYQFVHGLLRKEITTRYNPKKHKHLDSKPLTVKLCLIGSAVAFLVLSTTLPIIINTGKVDSKSELTFTPRLTQGERLLYERMSHHFFDLQRGDIIFFKPTDEMKRSGFGYLMDLKQILGRPGETIEIIKGEVYVNDEPLRNPNFTVHPDFWNYAQQKVPSEMYLVVVNNPNYSDDKDKFTINFIPKGNIDGRVACRYWPLHKIGTVDW